MPELTHRRRLLVLAVCCTSITVVGMDISIVNVALPAMREELHTSVSGLQWTVDAYTLVLAVFLVLAGSMADRVGRRRTVQIGLLTFGVGSALCALAPGPGWLVAARAVQAVGGTMLNPVAMAIVVTTFPDRTERARAIGVFGAISGLALGLGPIVGGALVDGLGWRSIFWVNVPIVAAAAVCAGIFVPESRAARARRFDPVGQVLVVLVLGSLVYAIIESGRLGWTSPVILGLLTVAALGVLGILGYERRRRDPLLELRLFRSVPFSAAIVVALCALCGFGSFLFVTTLYLQEVRGLPALTAGLSLLPVGVLIVVLSPITGRLVGTSGPRLPLAVAGAALALGGGASLLLGPSAPLPALLAVFLLFGVALGTVNTPVTNTAVAGMPASMAGVAGSLASVGRQTGTTLGVAISGAIVASALPHGAAAFTHAERAVWWLVLGLGLAVLALGLLSTGRWAATTATRAAALFDDIDARVPARPAGRPYDGTSRVRYGESDTGQRRLERDDERSQQPRAHELSGARRSKPRAVGDAHHDPPPVDGRARRGRGRRRQDPAGA